MPKLLKPEGIYSYFNGLAADNAFFHMVYCNIARAELQQLSLETEFVPLPIDCSNPKVWEGVRCDAMSPLSAWPLVLWERGESSSCACSCHRHWCPTRPPLFLHKRRHVALFAKASCTHSIQEPLYWQLDTYLLPVMLQCSASVPLEAPLIDVNKGRSSAEASSAFPVQEPLLAAGHLPAACLYLQGDCWRERSCCS